MNASQQSEGGPNTSLKLLPPTRSLIVNHPLCDHACLSKLETFVLLEERLSDL